MNTSNVALGVWKLRQWLQKAKVERKIGAEKALYLIEKELNDENIEVIDIAGKQYDAGLAVEVINNLNPEEKDSSKIFITEMVKPIIMKDNKVLGFGQVVIGKSIVVTEQATNPIVIEKPINKERTKLNWGDTFFKGISFAVLLLLLMNQFKVQQMINNQSSIINSKSEMITQLNGQNQSLNKSIETLIAQNETLQSDIEILKEDLGNSFAIEIYTVKSGDTLIDICNSFGLDYYAYKNLILSLNQISNPSEIVSGQKLLIIKKAVQ